MIGFLNGTVEYLDRPHVILDVNGVGYRVLVSDTVYSSLKTKDKTKLFTYTYVREDALDLFGFAAAEDLRLFEYLISVSGVGPKTALGIFSYGERDSIISAIIKGDVDFFTSVPRLGKKNAQKIIIELKNKMGGIVDLDLSGKDGETNGEITQVLKSFGFGAKEAQEALRAIKDQGETVEEKIKLALKYLGR